MARVGEGARLIARRVTAARPNDSRSIVRTPTASARGPTRNTKSVSRVEKVAAHHPARVSLMWWSVESQNFSVERKEKIPRYSKKVAA